MPSRSGVAERSSFEVSKLRTAARAALIVAAAAAAISLSACGGSSQGDAPQPQLGRAEFVREADRICDDAHRRAFKVSKKVQELVAAKQSGRVSEADYRFQVSKLTISYSKIADSAAQQIRALGAPPGDDRGLERYLAVVEGESKLFFRQSYALAHGQENQVRDLSLQTLRLSSQAKKLANALGFHTCGGG